MSSADGHLDGVGGDTRSALGIAWTCLAIIFACTWTAIHPNIPPKDVRQSEWRLRRWRLIQALWALLVPELMVMWAVQQWVEAGKVSQEYEDWARGNGHDNGEGRMQPPANDVEKNAANTIKDAESPSPGGHVRKLDEHTGTQSLHILTRPVPR